MEMVNKDILIKSTLIFLIINIFTKYFVWPFYTGAYLGFVGKQFWKMKKDSMNYTQL